MAEPWEVCVKCGGSAAPCECARPEVVEYVPRPDDEAVESIARHLESVGWDSIGIRDDIRDALAGI